MTLVVSASAGTDISVGAIMAVSAAVCCNLLSGGERAVTEYASPLILGFLAAIVVGVLIGCFNGFLVAKLNIQPMVATLIMFTAGRGIAQLITDGSIFSGNTNTNTFYCGGDNGSIYSTFVK